MTMKHGLVLLGCALALGACEEQALSIGELRCEGEGVVCEKPVAIGWNSDFDEPASQPEQEAALAWSADMPCPGAACDSREVQAVVHADGSTTVVRRIYVLDGDEGITHAVEHGIWLARYDADGALEWLNETLLRPVESSSSTEFQARLALDSDDRAVLCFVQRTPSDDTLTVFAVEGSGRLDPLFTTDGPALLGGMVVVDEDLVIAGYHFPPFETGEPSRPEVARFHRDGELVWRQTGLRFLGPPPELLELGDTVVDLPLAVDGEGRLWLSVVEASGRGFADFNLVRLEPDGNVRWLIWPIATEFPYGMRLAVSAAGTALLGQDSFPVSRFEEEVIDSSPQVLERQVMRPREDFWQPIVFAIDFDGEERALIATQDGARREPRMLIDRVSADFARRETFVVPELSEYVGDLGGLADLSTVEGNLALIYPFQGMRAVGDSVYLWGPEQLARVELP